MPATDDQAAINADTNPYAPPRAADLEGKAEVAAEPLVRSGPEGLGGWLILVIIGLFATPIRLGFFLRNTYIPIFTGPQWAALTTPSSPQYHPLWAPSLIFEVAGNSFFIILAIIALIHLFRKSRHTPKLVIGMYLASLTFVLIDTVLGLLIPAIANSTSVIDPQLVGTFIGCCIWIPYFLVSKRVKNTFVN